MVGSAADGQLIAPAQLMASRARFAVATPADDAALRRLLRETPLHGAISISFEREPDYFRGTGLAGAHDQTIVAFENNRLVCMGRCLTHDAWLNRAVRRVGYLGELRLASSAQGRFDILRGGYDYFHRLNDRNPAEFYFTSIAADNQRARRFLERGVRGMPRYGFLGELTTLLVSTSARTSASLPKRETASVDELAEFLNTVAGRHNLSTVWTPNALHALTRHGLNFDDFRVIRVNGKIAAAAALWDQRPFRQTVVRGYSHSLGLLRPVINSVGRLFALPRLPAPGSVLAHAFLFPPAVSPEHAHLLSELVAGFRSLAATKGFDCLTLALPSNHASLRDLRRRFHTRSYVTRLYRVSWPGDATLELDDRPTLPDIAFL